MNSKQMLSYNTPNKIKGNDMTTINYMINGRKACVTVDNNKGADTVATLNKSCAVLSVVTK